MWLIVVLQGICPSVQPVRTCRCNLARRTSERLSIVKNLAKILQRILAGWAQLLQNRENLITSGSRHGYLFHGS